ncbi:MAG TPA: VOC family protein [Acidimicrobiales bacterium]|nr:VOC family protein [Acidimicrobiales bacterium]
MKDLGERPRFHLAIGVDDLEAAANFYGEVLGCGRGRSDTEWIDWNLYGHQIVTHRVAAGSSTSHNEVDGHDVPIPHFGLILSVDDFHQLTKRLRANGITFVIEPYVRFAGSVGEQWTMFFRDPSGNAIECKAFADDAQVFRS